MVEDQGNVIIEGSDYLSGIASKRQRRGVDAHKILLKDVDESYKVFLEELFAFVDGGKGNTRTKFSSNSQEQIIEEWIYNENTENAVDCDVWHEVTENESGEGVDCDKSEMGRVEEEDDCDPDYKVFFQNIKCCGNAYVLEIARRNSTMTAKYEDEDADEFELPDERERMVPKSNCAGRFSNKTQRREGDRNSSRYRAKNTKRAQRYKRYYASSNGKRKAGDKEKNEAPICRRSSRKIARKSMVEDISSDDLQEGKSQSQSRVVSRNFSRSQRSKGERDKETVQTLLLQKMDEVYVEFLSGLKTVGKYIVYTGKDGTQYRYDECTDERASDSNAEALAKLPPSNRMTPKPSNKRLRSPTSNTVTPEPSNKGLRLPASNRVTPEPSNKRLCSSDKKAPSGQMIVKNPSSEYRKKLMGILLKPYDPKEYRDLLKEAKLRRPVLHYKDMRSQNCSFPDEVEVDKSYLDRFWALNTEIEAAQHDDPHKVLQLLRGLFFYLQYVCMEGSFLPWNDKSWLEAVHKSTSKRHQ